jgi:hypothetical protein
LGDDEPDTLTLTDEFDDTYRDALPVELKLILVDIVDIKVPELDTEPVFVEAAEFVDVLESVEVGEQLDVLDGVVVVVCDGVDVLDGVIVCDGVLDGVGRTQLVIVTDPGVPSAPSTMLPPIALPIVDEITIAVFT